VHGTGTLSSDDVSRHLNACDVMVQPYPDGVSTRRTTAMAALAHGRPLATTCGVLTEPLWAASSAVSLAPAGDVSTLAMEAAALAADPARAARMGSQGAALYELLFDVRHTVAALRSPAADPSAPTAEGSFLHASNLATTSKGAVP
jgi:glycosyltransferase involved in cell wall biosynthesis